MSKEINTEEQAIWEGRPSQWINIRTYAYSVILTTLIVIVLIIVPKFQWLFALCLLYPVGRSLFAWYEVRSISYKLTETRLLHREGVFNRVTSETKLSDVKEVLLVEPWYKRIVGLGDVRLNIKGFAESYVTISGIRKAEEIKEII
ncbi:MAG: PH domain-containing protein, partial [Prevotellaceae bacterium]|nr:PH domain-containing protein [Prevotellaceae bacterium]